MFSIRSQIAIGVISSVLLTTIILVIAVQWSYDINLEHYNNDYKLFNTIDM